jgi:hypothetical protein
MMQNGAVKLAPFAGRYTYVEYDMNLGQWPAELTGPFAAAVSARAIHHLPNEAKGVLFRRVLEALSSGGVFVNWDRFRDPSEAVDPTNAHQRTVATIEEQLDLLRAAGFASVSCSHEVGRRAMFFGSKA